jgi:UPF0755 protein
MTERRPRKRKTFLAWGLLALSLLLCGLFLAAYFVVPAWVAQTYGPASARLGGVQRFEYAFQMLWYDSFLRRPANSMGSEIPFSVAEGEGVASVAARLQQAGLIWDATAFRAYLIYAGLDTGLQAGEFILNPALAPVQIAHELQDATPEQIKFGVLPGWRVEEIAASLPTSGLQITPQEFLMAARDPRPGFDFFPPGAPAEGFLMPGEYIVPREINSEQLVQMLMRNFALSMTQDLRAAFTRQGLDVYQAVTLASIVQREAIQVEEQPLIASALLNRLVAGMRLETDPTIQYALGYVAASNSWWKSPLNLNDLLIDSPFNTYLHTGLPPGPISNPSLSALQAVAYPAQTPYYFFRARCDDSGLHNFSETFEQHNQNACP